MVITNKRAFFNYSIFEKIEAGIVLTGGEARAIRTGHMNLSNSYAKIVGGEVFLVNADVPVPGAKNYDPTHMRKLLLNRQEITAIGSQLKLKRLTLVPLKVYSKGRLIKVELGLAKSKREYEKRENLKKKDVLRDLEQSRLSRD